MENNNVSENKVSGMEKDFTPVKLTKKQEVIKGLIFLLASISAAVIQILVFTLLREGFHLDYWVSYIPSVICSVLWSFTVNRKLTFKSVSNIPVAMIKVIIYYLAFIPLSAWWGEALVKLNWGISDGLRDFIILFGTMIINLITEFLVYRLWVYPKSINSSASGQKEQEKYEGAAETATEE